MRRVCGIRRIMGDIALYTGRNKSILIANRVSYHVLIMYTVTMNGGLAVAELNAAISVVWVCVALATEPVIAVAALVADGALLVVTGGSIEWT